MAAVAKAAEKVRGGENVPRKGTASIEATKNDLRIYGGIKRRGGNGEETQEFERQVEEALSKLKTAERQALTWTYIDGKTNEQAAEAGGCDPVTISRRKRRGIKHMAAALHAGQYIRDNRMI